jgi:hypothetical protein
MRMPLPAATRIALFMIAACSITDTRRKHGVTPAAHPKLSIECHYSTG